jgi:hypothetical protein
MWGVKYARNIEKPSIMSQEMAFHNIVKVASIILYRAWEVIVLTYQFSSVLIFQILTFGFCVVL